MKFSLILCTVNREIEVKELLDSLVRQTFKHFEVIVVDQNQDDRIKLLLLEYECLNIVYLQSDLGLSKARNVGLKYYTGDIVCFPDDDCIYPQELLHNVNQYFLLESYDILMGKTIDENSYQIVAGKNITTRQKLSTFYTLGSSTTLFVRRSSDIEFDEQFGLGSIFGAEEENDLVFRLLKRGYTGYYNPSINYVFHPPSDLDFSDLGRVKSRAIGLGAFIAKHLFTAEGAFYFIKFNIIRPLFGCLLFLFLLDLKKSNFYLNRWIGIWKGFIGYMLK
ncbi:glycosyltransferase family 2 protein [Vibrio algarum]|uniref:Glycosyltransferase family A protein n=1 Tax=Vibrio algarum TaxID=3020714 RepID=A0ABT4YML6_9VIBR|nr:glycosyltransferase family A protein [Vibrio sp. KJ40-1]MDB1122413.1 glycosyltransferase family A protein [Vibrio sp. KJ40-1]